MTWRILSHVKAKNAWKSSLIITHITYSNSHVSFDPLKLVFLLSLISDSRGGLSIKIVPYTLYCSEGQNTYFTQQWYTYLLTFFWVSLGRHTTSTEWRTLRAIQKRRVFVESSSVFSLSYLSNNGLESRISNIFLPNQNIHATSDNFKDFPELQFI